METSTPRAKAEPAGLTAYVAEFITSTRSLIFRARSCSWARNRFLTGWD